MNFAMLVFIIGPPRSGTTALYEALIAHPDIAGLSYEAHRFHHDLARFSHRVRGEDHFWLTSADATESLRGEYEAALPDASVRLVKVSTSSIQIDFIRVLFPEALFVQLLREPLDVIASMEALRLGFEAEQDHPRLLGPAPDPLGLRIAEAFESKFLRAAGSWFFHAVRSESDLRFAGFDRLHRLSYYDLVHSPREALQALLVFIGLDWRPELEPVVLSIDNRPQGAGSLGFSHVEAGGGRRIGRFARTMSPDIVQAIAPLIAEPARVWGFEPIAAGGDLEAACDQEHVPAGPWRELVDEVTRDANRELQAFDPARFLLQPDEIARECAPLLRRGTVIDHQWVSGEGVGTTTVYKQDRRYRFADPAAAIARLLPALDGVTPWGEHALALEAPQESARVLERLHGLSFVAF